MLIKENKPMAQNFCSNCGAPLTQPAGFCGKCGEPLQAPNPIYQHNDTQTPPQYYPYPPQAPYGYPPMYMKPKIPGKGFATASMVLGIIAVVISFSMLMSAIETITLFKTYGPIYDTLIEETMLTEMLSMIIVSCIYGILSILSIIFSLIAFGRKYKKGKSISGLTMGLISLVFFAVTIILAIPYV